MGLHPCVVQILHQIANKWLHFATKWSHFCEYFPCQHQRTQQQFYSSDSQGTHCLDVYFYLQEKDRAFKLRSTYSTIITRKAILQHFQSFAAPLIIITRITMIITVSQSTGFMQTCTETYFHTKQVN